MISSITSIIATMPKIIMIAGCFFNGSTTMDYFDRCFWGDDFVVSPLTSRTSFGSFCTIVFLQKYCTETEAFGAFPEARRFGQKRLAAEAGVLPFVECHLPQRNEALKMVKEKGPKNHENLKVLGH